MLGDDLKNSKFSIVVAPKNEYGLAYLKLKFREKGLDIDDLKVSQDLSEFKRNGYSINTIDFKLKKYEKNVQNDQDNINQTNFHHPREQELNELQRQKKIAKQNNDEVLYKYSQSCINKIIRESRMEISPKQWDSMNIQDKIAFVKIKINEAKILGDKDEFDYWNTVIKSLNEKKQHSAENTTKNNNHNGIDLSVLIKQLKDELHEVKYDYRLMILDGNIDDTELSTLLEKINKIINDGYSLKSLASDPHDLKTLTIIIDSLKEGQTKMKNMQSRTKENGRSKI